MIPMTSATTGPRLTPNSILRWSRMRQFMAAANPGAALRSGIKIPAHQHPDVGWQPGFRSEHSRLADAAQRRDVTVASERMTEHLRLTETLTRQSLGSQASRGRLNNCQHLIEQRRSITSDVRFSCVHLERLWNSYTPSRSYHEVADTGVLREY
jgi:hypothetical protein